MNFVCGTLSAEKGISAFCKFKVSEIKSLAETPKAFTLMSYFIATLVDRCVTQGEVFDWIEVSFEEVEDLIPDLTESKFENILNRLKRLQLIKAQKLKDEWQIQII